MFSYIIKDYLIIIREIAQNNNRNTTISACQDLLKQSEVVFPEISSNLKKYMTSEKVIKLLQQYSIQDIDNYFEPSLIEPHNLNDSLQIRAVLHDNMIAEFKKLTFDEISNIPSMQYMSSKELILNIFMIKNLLQADKVTNESNNYKHKLPEWLNKLLQNLYRPYTLKNTIYKISTQEETYIERELLTLDEKKMLASLLNAETFDLSTMFKYLGWEYTNNGDLNSYTLIPPSMSIFLEPLARLYNSINSGELDTEIESMFKSTLNHIFTKEEDIYLEYMQNSEKQLAIKDIIDKIRNYLGVNHLQLSTQNSSRNLLPF